VELAGAGGKNLCLKKFCGYNGFCSARAAPPGAYRFARPERKNIQGVKV
jgi:hypothetical protein